MNIRGPRTDAISGVATIAIVEDEEDLRQAVEQYLTSHGYRVLATANAASYRKLAGSTPVNVAILDIAMPGETGLSLAQWIRARGETGIIFATASGAPIDRIVGLEAGADDYIVKPYGLRELLARVKGLIRRLPTTTSLSANDSRAIGSSRQVSFGNHLLDLDKQALQTSGAGVALSATEYRLLELLVTRTGRVQSRQDIVRSLGSTALNSRAIDTAISRLRKKIETDPANPRHIRSVRGEGYVFHTDSNS